MENKKNVKQNFLQRFSNFKFRKIKTKREMKKRKKGKNKREEPILLSHASSCPTTQHIFYLYSDREIRYMIVIIKSNISSYN